MCTFFHSCYATLFIPSMTDNSTSCPTCSCEKAKHICIIKRCSVYSVEKTNMNTKT